MSPADTLLSARLASLKAQRQLRVRTDLRAFATDAAASKGRELVDLSSNDYLGFASRPAPIEAYAPGGAGASRLIFGSRSAHGAAERALAAWARQEDALVFTSGYAANLGLVSALAQPGDLVLSDALNHASIIDGCRLTKADVRTFPHRDIAAASQLLQQTEGRHTWVITESYFSMDGTIPDLRGLAALVERTENAYLLVDEAHALGVYGPGGAGVCAELGIRPTACVGTFGKALGLQGAFVSGSRVLCDWLWNRARPFVYSTAPSPALISAVPKRLEEVQMADSRRRHLFELCAMFHVKLRSVLPDHYPDTTAPGPVVPLVVGSEQAALSIRDALLTQGILTQAIRPPTVPDGASRVRLSLHAALTASDLDYTLEHLVSAIKGSEANK